MKRNWVLCVVSIFLFTALTAFAAPGPGGYPAYTGQPVELTEWAWTSNENFSNDLFTKAYPDIKIKWTNNGVPYAQILTATAAGSGLPDVIMSEYTYAPQFMTNGSFQAINKWVSRDTYLKYYPEVTLKWCAMDGQIYGTPQDSGAATMVYRKDIFDKYKMTVPRTWAEFETQVTKLHNADPSINGLSFPANWVLGPMGLVWQAGTKLFDYANGKWKWQQTVTQTEVPGMRRIDVAVRHAEDSVDAPLATVTGFVGRTQVASQPSSATWDYAAIGTSGGSTTRSTTGVTTTQPTGSSSGGSS